MDGNVASGIRLSWTHAMPSKSGIPGCSSNGDEDSRLSAKILGLYVNICMYTYLLDAMKCLLGQIGLPLDSLQHFFDASAVL